MPKIVVIGSCKYEPYVVLIVPNKLNPKLYEKNHEKAFEEASKVFQPKIEECDEVWVYAPDGIGKHTLTDLIYAQRLGKKVRVLVDLEQKGSGYLTSLFFTDFYRELEE